MSSQPAQSRTIRAQLLSDMREGLYADAERLPRESVLAEKLGISRTQLRDILASLEREGFITRRHGVGTVINRHVLSVYTRMDIEIEFLDMIRQSGYQAAVASVHVSDDLADAQISRQLKIPEGTPVIRVDRLCTADGRPAIYCEDFIDRSRIQKPFTLEDLQSPIFHFLQEFCGVCAYLDLTDLRPVTADAALAEIFQVPEGAPLLFMDEVDFDIDGNPILCSGILRRRDFPPHRASQEALRVSFTQGGQHHEKSCCYYGKRFRLAGGQGCLHPAGILRHSL